VFQEIGPKAKIHKVPIKTNLFSSAHYQTLGEHKVGYSTAFQYLALPSLNATALLKHLQNFLAYKYHVITQQE
jgi:hypothetical protein